MKKEEYLIDDRVIIPDEIMRMSKEERHAEIARLEKEAAFKKEQKSRNNPAISEAV